MTAGRTVNQKIADVEAWRDAWSGLSSHADKLAGGEEWSVERKAERGAWNNFVQAAMMSWHHIEQCRPYTAGEGYGWRTGQPECPDPALHSRRLTEEGEAWHSWRTLARKATLAEDWPNGCPACWMNPTDHDYPDCPEYAAPKTDGRRSTNG